MRRGRGGEEGGQKKGRSGILAYRNKRFHGLSYWKSIYHR